MDAFLLGHGVYCHILVFSLFQAISQNVICDIRQVFPDRITFVHLVVKQVSVVIDNLRISHNASGMGANIRVLVT